MCFVLLLFLPSLIVGMSVVILMLQTHSKIHFNAPINVCRCVIASGRTQHIVRLIRLNNSPGGGGSQGENPCGATHEDAERWRAGDDGANLDVQQLQIVCLYKVYIVLDV